MFLSTERAGTNLCWMIQHLGDFKIGLTSLGQEEKKLYNVHIVQWCGRSRIIATAHSLEWTSKRSALSNGRRKRGGWEVLKWSPMESCKRWFSSRIGHMGCEKKDNVFVDEFQEITKSLLYPYGVLGVGGGWRCSRQRREMNWKIASSVTCQSSVWSCKGGDCYNLSTPRLAQIQQILLAF